MKSTFVKAIAGASLALAVGLAGTAVNAAALRPGNYDVNGDQQICLVSGGTWYGETFPSWGGDWGAGPTGQTYIFGNYTGDNGPGTGNDSMIVAHQAVQWTEWQDDLSYTAFITGSFSRIKGPCTSPDVSVKSSRHNPLK